jgi:hypothetical protein
MRFHEGSERIEPQGGIDHPAQQLLRHIQVIVEQRLRSLNEHAGSEGLFVPDSAEDLRGELPIQRGNGAADVLARHAEGEPASRVRPDGQSQSPVRGSSDQPPFILVHTFEQREKSRRGGGR